MSRVDDDRDAARLAERLLLKKQQEQARAKDKNQSESAFAKLVKEGQQEKTQTGRKGEQTRQAGSRLYSEVLEEALGESLSAGQDDAKQAQARGGMRQVGKAFDDKLRQAGDEQGERQGEIHKADEDQDAMARLGRRQDQKAEQRAEARRSDGKASEEFAARGRASAHGAQASARDDELATDGDGGGGQGDGGGEKKDGGGEMASGFRFNPALMAPVPVARPKSTGASERLRALANEIAQKIVERVRVGTNAAGQAEFQIDLRSNVLAGLSIKVSGGNGKIKAVFSGNDREVLKLLREQSDGLKSALSGRGLALEELRIEERA